MVRKTKRLERSVFFIKMCANKNYLQDKPPESFILYIWYRLSEDKKKNKNNKTK